MKRPIELMIPAQPDYVSVARLCLAGIGARLALPLETIEELKVALAEACTNAIQHAYPKGGEQNSIRILFSLEGEALVIRVEDQGLGFEPKRVLVPPQPDQERGFGIYLIKALADEVEVQSTPGKGTKVTLRKILHEQAPPQTP